MPRHQGWTNLVITRREGENIVIGDPKNPIAVVHLASIRGDRVRIGIETDRSVPVHREEVADEIAKEGGVDAKAKGYTEPGADGKFKHPVTGKPQEFAPEDKEPELDDLKDVPGVHGA